MSIYCFLAGAACLATRDFTKTIMVSPHSFNYYKHCSLTITGSAPKTPHKQFAGLGPFSNVVGGDASIKYILTFSGPENGCWDISYKQFGVQFSYLLVGFNSLAQSTISFITITSACSDPQKSQMAGASNLFARSATFTEPSIQKLILEPGLEDDVRKLNSKYLFFDAVLSDAENRQVLDKPVQVWLDNLRDISCEIENVLDVWNTALIKIEISDAEKTGNRNNLTYMPSSQAHSSWLEQLALEQYIPSKIRELNERLDEIYRQKDTYNFKLEDVAAQVPLRRESTSFIKASMVIGRDQETDLLITKLCEAAASQNARPGIISINGFGGIGKTTLAQRIYNDAKVETHFEERIWVCVSDPFDGMQVAKSIANSLDVHVSISVDLQNLLKRIEKSIANRRFLLVLDDVWTEKAADWEPLLCSLESGAIGSQVLVTTRSVKCSTAIRSTYTHQLGILSEEESWKLFTQIAFSIKDEQVRGDLEEVGKSIAEKCKGLPLAIKTVGGLLQFKSATEKEWRKVLASEIWELEAAEKEIFSPLLLSYYELPLPLKRCFSYCATFPKDYEFEVKKLIRLWMALGYLKSTSAGDMETIGEEYFQELAMRSYFQDFKCEGGDGSVIKACKMHDIVHDFAQFIARNRCAVVDAGRKKQDANLSCSAFNANKVRHVTLVQVTNIEDITSNVRTQDLHTVRISKRLSEWLIIESLIACQHLRFLKVLDLSHSIIRKVPEEIGELVHLRYLDLSECKFERLPQSTVELCNLQTLLLNHCDKLREVPIGIEKLINLRHLEIDWGTVLPKGIGRIESLRTLNRFVVSGCNDGEEGASIAELRKLNNLAGSLEIGGLKNVANGEEAKKAELKSKTNLTSLRLDFANDYRETEDAEDVIEALEPHGNLESLIVRGYNGKLLPSWILLLSKLKKLVLGPCSRCERFPALGTLPVLEELILLHIDNVKRIGEEMLGISVKRNRNIEFSKTSSKPNVIVAFPKLKHLEFMDMEEWEEWEEETAVAEDPDEGVAYKIFPQLEYLKIWYCPKLKSLPQFILRAPIQDLIVKYSSILEARCDPKKRGDLWPQISHIPHIEIGGKVMVNGVLIQQPVLLQIGKINGRGDLQKIFI